MKILALSLISGMAFALSTAPASLAASAEVGQPAPEFTLTDIDGASHQLSEYRGKIVVLEWVNPECPFVKKHYNRSGNIPGLQKAAATDGVVWLSINSAASGKQGDFDAPAVKAWQKQIQAAAADYFRDTTGAVGHLYGAKTTPHIFIVDKAGTLVYAGGIDSIASADPADIARAENYVSAALADLKAGSPIAKANTHPYGCSVKY